MTNLSQALSEDHADHEQLLLRLADALNVKASPAVLRQCWVTFEANLLDHLDTEERSLFCVAERAHPIEVERLRVEHRRILQAATAHRTRTS